MRSRLDIKTAIFVAGALFLSGCLISEEPVLDAATGKATPLSPGSYISCSVEEDADEPDCTSLQVSHDDSGLYTIVTDDDETIEWRFRRVARSGYALQSHEDDDEFAYYYARSLKSGMKLTFMQCPSLPEGLRERLINRGDIETEDEDFDTCTVLTVKGLVDAAKAYHRGRADDDEEIAVVITPAPDGGE